MLNDLNIVRVCLLLEVLSLFFAPHAQQHQHYDDWNTAYYCLLDLDEASPGMVQFWPSVRGLQT